MSDAIATRVPMAVVRAAAAIQPQLVSQARGQQGFLCPACGSTSDPSSMEHSQDPPEVVHTAECPADWSRRYFAAQPDAVEWRYINGVVALGSFALSLIGLAALIFVRRWGDVIGESGLLTALLLLGWIFELAAMCTCGIFIVRFISRSGAFDDNSLSSEAS